MSYALPAVSLAGAIVGTTGQIKLDTIKNRVSYDPAHAGQDGHIRIYNESGCLLKMTTDTGDEEYVPAGAWYGHSVDVALDLITYEVLGIIPSAPVTLLLLVYYPPGEDIPPTPTLGNSPVATIGGGGGVATTLSNEGNALGTLVIDMGDVAFPNIFTLFNDGACIWAVDQTGVSHQVLQVSNAGTPLTLGALADTVGVIGTLSVGVDANVTGNITGMDVTANHDLLATNNVSGVDVIASGDVTATGDVSGFNVVANQDVTATRDILATRNVGGVDITGTGVVHGNSVTSTTTVAATTTVSGADVEASNHVTGLYGGFGGGGANTSIGCVVRTPTDAKKGIVVYQAAGTQTANIFEVQDHTFDPKVYVTGGATPHLHAKNTLYADSNNLALQVPNGYAEFTGGVYNGANHLELGVGVGQHVDLRVNATDIVTVAGTSVTTNQVIDAKGGVKNSVADLEITAEAGNSIDFNHGVGLTMELLASVINCYQELDVLGAGSAIARMFYLSNNSYISMKNNAGTETEQFSTSLKTLNGNTSGTMYCYQILHGNNYLMFLYFNNFRNGGAAQTLQLDWPIRDGWQGFVGDLGGNNTINMQTVLGTPMSLREIRSFANVAPGVSGPVTVMYTFGYYKGNGIINYIGIPAAQPATGTGTVFIFASGPST